ALASAFAAGLASGLVAVDFATGAFDVLAAAGLAELAGLAAGVDDLAAGFAAADFAVVVLAVAVFLLAVFAEVSAITGLTLAFGGEVLRARVPAPSPPEFRGVGCGFGLGVFAAGFFAGVVFAGALLVVALTGLTGLLLSAVSVAVVFALFSSAVVYSFCIVQ